MQTKRGLSLGFFLQLGWLKFTTRFVARVGSFAEIHKAGIQLFTLISISCWKIFSWKFWLFQHQWRIAWVAIRQHYLVQFSSSLSQVIYTMTERENCDSLQSFWQDLVWGTQLFCLLSQVSVLKRQVEQLFSKSWQTDVGNKYVQISLLNSFSHLRHCFGKSRKDKRER